MNRRIASIVGALALAIAIPATTLAGPSASLFAGSWVSTDFDGSSQLLLVSGGGHPSVVYQDFFASSCDTFAGPDTHWVAAGQGSIEDDMIWIQYRKSGCGTFHQGGYEDYYVYDAGSDTLIDSVGIVWSRRT